MAKKTKRTAATLPDDVLLEILFSVPTDVAALFRCAATCKRWCALVADPSFLRRRWPENTGHTSALLGFFVQQRQRDDAGVYTSAGCVDIDSPEPPVFVPAPLGDQRRFLTSFVTGVPTGLLDGAKPVTARNGLLLVRLARGSPDDSVHLAVCDPLARTCDVLRALKCGVSAISCTILTGSDYRSSDGLQHRTSTPGYSAFFTVLTLFNYVDRKHYKCDLYTFSSAKPSWSAPRSCFGDKIFSKRKGGFWMPYGNITRKRQKHNVVVCGGMTHWLAVYQSMYQGRKKYHTFNVNNETGHFSLTELSISADQLTTSRYGWPVLSVGVDRTLRLFHVYNEAGLPRLDIWTCRGDDGGESGTLWLCVGVFYLKSPKERWLPSEILVWSGEKGGVVFILDAWSRVHKLDTVTGVMEDVTGLFQHGLCISAVPMEIEYWPALFMSRLGGHLC